MEAILMSPQVFIRFVILLAVVATSSLNCALLPSQKEDFRDDPIARAALLTQSSFSREEDQILEDRRSFQNEEIQKGLRSGDIVVGMLMNDVLDLWGQPRDVETAGDSKSGNQKWIYLDSLSSRWGLHASRTVYFEEGKVVGWDNQR